ncbi:MULTISPECIES: hypothetical protein [Burkholderia]|uniref:hypothetical protein n=1 Tax=Burkholderia TaxID=32008 RepID=UPI00158E651B|nr:hypothetical protein [Burkholderia ambifaria]
MCDARAPLPDAGVVVCCTLLSIGASGAPTIRDTERPSLEDENREAKSAILFSGGTRNWLWRASAADAMQSQQRQVLDPSQHSFRSVPAKNRAFSLLNLLVVA